MTFKEKINNGREYRNFQMPLEIRAKDDKEMIVEGYATIFNEPYIVLEDKNYRVLEQVDKNAFDKTDMSDVIMQYDHEGRVFARNSNKTLEVYADDKGLYIRAYLGGTELGRQLYDEIKGGYTNKMSFGFVVNVDTKQRSKKDGITEILRTITGIKKLYDVSAVSIPANDATSISTRKLGEGVINELKTERMRVEAEEEMRKHKTKALELKLKLMEV